MILGEILHCLTGVHHSCPHLFVGLGRHHARLDFRLLDSGLFQGGRVCRRIQLRRRPGISQRQTNNSYVHSQTAAMCKVFILKHLSSAPIGWAAAVTYNPKAKAEFERFRRRSDTLSLGVCNGCQLLALLGWVGEAEEDGSGARRNNAMVVNLCCRYHTAAAFYVSPHSPSR